MYDNEDSGVVRARFVTFLMGYVDDVACQIKCKGPSSVTLMQSQVSAKRREAWVVKPKLVPKLTVLAAVLQSRLGIGDLGANLARLQRLSDGLMSECGASKGMCTGECRT